MEDRSHTRWPMPSYVTDPFVKNYICSVVWCYALQVCFKKFHMKDRPVGYTELPDSSTIVWTCWHSFKIYMQFSFDVVSMLALGPKESKWLNKSCSFPLFSQVTHSPLCKKHFSRNHEPMSHTPPAKVISLSATFPSTTT